MDTASCPDSAVIGEWHACRATGELVGASSRVRLEPKVMDLLLLLASRPDGVFSKDEIMLQLWPRVIVGEDTLARTVSKLRKALGDDPKEPRFVETIPKRGYRLMAPKPPARHGADNPPVRTPARTPLIRAHAGAVVVAIGVVLSLAVWLGFSTPRTALAEARVVVERANDFYFQYSRPENEAAIELYERILVSHPDYAPAYAGLANALVQKVIRWPDGSSESGTIGYSRLGDALQHGNMRSPPALRLLQRAEQLAQQAVQLAPNDAASHKALGLVLSARMEFDRAIESYRRAVALDADAWGPLINIGDVLELSGRADEALPYFEAAYAAMTRVYDSQTTRIQPWYAELGVLIGDRYRASGRLREAQGWYQRVLDYAPLHPKATGRLATVLSESGHQDAARLLCENFRQHIDSVEPCAMASIASAKVQPDTPQKR
ncbi:winged helix-turn-helix domain-containing protein [Dokdonella soli]|uniref:OmpR/PhoB-type domain-containing protein n=1 Tax=Dokdonella soli TaxID=529810 RepID=A0ABP3TQY8_9GAMM